MAEAQTTPARDWKKRESFSMALLQIGAVALVLVIALFINWQRLTKKKAIADLLREARATSLRDNPKDLEKALATLDEVFKLDGSSPDGLAIAADVHTELWLVHRVPGAEAKAKDFLARAEKEDSKSEERFGTRALHMVQEGKAKDADAYIDGLRAKGASTARLWFAQARAQQDLGNLSAARTAFAQAMDKSWKDPRFSSGYGEALLNEGQFLQAFDALTKATNNNHEHQRARLTLALARIHKKDRVKDATDTINELLALPDLTPGMKARALAGKAELANFENRFDDAVAAATEALASNEDEHYALFAKARALALKKDAGAADAFKAAVAKRKTAPYLYFDGATLLQAAGNTDGALALLDTYAEAFKDVKVNMPDGKTVAFLDRDDRYWLTRGDVYRASDKLDEAMAAYEKGIAAENVNLAKAHYAKATILIARKDYDKATEVLANITPPDGSGALPDAYAALGDTLFFKKDFAAGCQSYAFALAKMKAQQVPREKLNDLLTDVQKRLQAAGQGAMAKVWMDEAKPLIQ